MQTLTAQKLNIGPLIILGGLAIASILAFFTTPTALAILLATILVAVSLKRVEYGILLLAVYTPLEPFLLKFVPDDLYLIVRYGGEVFMIVLVLVLLFQRLAKQDFKLKRSPIDLALIIFLVISGVSMVFRTVGPAYVGFLGLRQILRYAILYYLIIYAKPERTTVRIFIQVMLGIMFFQAVVGFAQAMIGAPADSFLLPGKRRGFPALDIPTNIEQFWASGQRIFATMGRYDLLGIFLSFFMLIAVGLAYETKLKETRHGLWLLVFAVVPTMVLTYSRMSWLGLFFGGAMIGIVLKRDKRLIIGLLMVILMITSYVSIYVMANSLNINRITDQPKMAVAERFLEMFSLRSLKWGYRGHGRPYFIVHTVTDVVRHYPIIGVGPGQYGGGVAFALHLTDRYDEFGLPFGIQDSKGQIDNNWFAIWGETGTLGVIAYFLIILALWRYSYRAWQESNDPLTKGLALGYMGALTAVFFQNFLGPYFEARTISMYIWLFGGLVVAQREREKLTEAKQSLT